MISNTRLYGAAIAVVSGLYSVWSASTAHEMVASAWMMGVIGVVVIVHGAILLTDYATHLDRTSGLLMIGYAAVMLLIQALLASDMMHDGSTISMGGSMTTMGMGWDVGMVSLAALMLVSGVIMTRDNTTEGTVQGM